MAAQSYRLSGASSSDRPLQRILCLHGWMDNCRSHSFLASHLLKNWNKDAEIELVALDLPGHGLSSHQGPHSPPCRDAFGDYVYYVAEAVRALGWDNFSETDANDSKKGSEPPPPDHPFTMVGHSMGACITAFYAATFPEQVQNIVLLEGVSPLLQQDEPIASVKRMHVLKRLQGNIAYTKSPQSTTQIYPTIEHAVKARQIAAEKMQPGNQWISEAGARALSERALRRVTEDGQVLPDDNIYTGPVQFRHDPRLVWHPKMHFSMSQLADMYASIECPVCMLMGKDGWPYDEATMKPHMEALSPDMYALLPGSHHFHIDPETAPIVAEHVLEFLQYEAKKKRGEVTRIDAAAQMLDLLHQEAKEEALASAAMV